MITLSLVVAFLVACILCTYYRLVLRPSLCDGIRFKLFASRDRLRMMAVKTEEDPNSFSYRYLEYVINGMINQSERVNVGEFMEFLVSHRRSGPTENYKRFKSESSAGLQDIAQNAVFDTIGLMMLNSPRSILVVVGLCIAVLFKRAGVVVLSMMAWENMNSEPLPQVA